MKYRMDHNGQTSHFARLVPLVLLRPQHVRMYFCSPVVFVQEYFQPTCTLVPRTPRERKQTLRTLAQNVL